MVKDNIRFKPEYFVRLYDLEARNFWFRSRNHLIIWALKQFFTNAKNFLEIGCGTGFVLSGIEKELPWISLFGGEIYTEGLSFAQRRLKKAELFQMDAQRIPFENEFDVIGAFDVIEHIEDDVKVLNQMHKAVNSGGGIILTVPQHKFLWSKTDEYACHVRRYNTRELKAKIENAGFRIVKMTSFVSLLLPFMAISRLKKKYVSGEYDPVAELKLNSLLDAVFERVMDIERSLIRSGFKLPFGGSLLLVARKV